MPTILEQIVLARDERKAADERFVELLKAGRESGLSWVDLAAASGLTIGGVRYYLDGENEKRRKKRIAMKGENDGTD